MQKKSKCILVKKQLDLFCSHPSISTFIAAGRFEFWMIVLPGNMSCRKSGYYVATVPWDKEYHIEELGKLYPLEFLDQKVTIMNEFQDIKLSAEESILIKSIVLTFPGLCDTCTYQKYLFNHETLHCHLEKKNSKRRNE